MALLVGFVALMGWIAYFIERDAARFHKQMSDYWHGQAVTATDRWLSVIEEDGALLRAAASSAGPDTPTEGDAHE